MPPSTYAPALASPPILPRRRRSTIFYARPMPRFTWPNAAAAIASRRRPRCRNRELRRSAALKPIDSGQAQQRRQLVERAPGLVKQRRIREVVGRQSIAIMTADPAFQRIGKRCIQEYVRVDPRALGRRQYDAKTKTGRAAAVLHALVEVE